MDCNHWEESIEIRLKSPLPEEFRISIGGVKEFLGDVGDWYAQHYINRHEEWTRRYGIPLYYKSGGVWFTTYPESGIKKGK